jgi:hypothetical protein
MKQPAGSLAPGNNVTEKLSKSRIYMVSVILIKIENNYVRKKQK